MSTKFITTVLLLSITILAGATLTPKDDWFKSRNPFTVALSSALYTVSSYDKYQLDIFPSRPNGTECFLKMNSANESITGKIKAAALYHKIVVWGKREETSNGFIRYTNYTIALVEPEKCTAYVFSDLVDEVPSTYPDLLPEVMAHQDSFDIFFPSQRGCSPCSYDVNGERIQREEQLIHEGSPGAPFYLREIGVTNNYLYLYNFDNGTAAIRSINSKFKDRFYPSRQLIINATVNNLVVKETDGKSYAGISYVLQDSPRRPRYLLFNEDLEILFSANLPLLDYYEHVDTSIAIDSSGYSYITLVQQSGETRKITRVVYAPSGRIVSNVEIYELQPNAEFRVQSVVNENQYCLVVHQLSGKLETRIKCRSLI